MMTLMPRPVTLRLVLRHCIPAAAALLGVLAAVLPAHAQSIAGRLMRPSPEVATATDHLRYKRFDDLKALYERTAASQGRGMFGDPHSEEFFLAVAMSAEDFIWRDIDERTAAWVAHAPDYPPAAIARAKALLKRAIILDRRNDWKGTESVVAEAGRLLASVPPAKRTDGAWHEAWLTFGRFEGWPVAKVKAATEAAAAADPYPLGTYLAAARALSPDRRQSPALLHWLAELAAKRAGPEGPVMYSRVYINAAHLFPEVVRQPFARGNIDWARLHKGMEDLTARFPKAYEAEDHAALACRAKDRTATRALIERLPPAKSRDHFEFWGGPAFFDQCRQWASER